jgi:L-ascorbate metabolism protein UlaG (beta-lactamase superfamily)
MDWWQTAKLDDTAELTYTRTQHWSRRSFRDQNCSLWGGFVLRQNSNKIYFGGDAGYSDAFKETYQRCGAMDLALIPIGAYEPRWFMKGHHMNPAEAVLAHKDLQSRRSVGIHYGCFQLTDEGLDDPLIALEQARIAAGIDAEEFSTLEVGETRRYQL